MAVSLYSRGRQIVQMELSHSVSSKKIVIKCCMPKDFEQGVTRKSQDMIQLWIEIGYPCRDDFKLARTVETFHLFHAKEDY